MATETSYFRATRHPWPCLVFMLPLLAAYETGVYLLGGTQAQTLRNGADAWLRWLLDVYGVKPFLAAPLIIVAVFVIWTANRWSDRPGHTLTTVIGMWLESIAFAIVLWQFGNYFDPLLKAAGIKLATTEITIRTDVLVQIVTYVGAGIYEEVLFRLFIITGLAALLKCAAVPNWAALLLAGIGSSLLFAAAHHIGQHGEPMDSYRFIYRTVAGMYFAILFWWRGFGVAVGTHALYDVIVGVKIG